MITCYCCGEEYSDNKFYEGSDTCVFCEREQERERTKSYVKRAKKVQGTNDDKYRDKERREARASKHRDDVE